MLFLQNTMSSGKISAKLKEIQNNLNDLTEQFNSIPCLTIDGLQAIPFDTEDNWKINVFKILNSTHIYKSWILNIVNPSDHTHPNTVTLQFINTIVRDHSYHILSNYVISNEYDTLIVKDSIVINHDSDD